MFFKWAVVGRVKVGDLPTPPENSAEHPPGTGIGGVGNKRVTSKCGYRYQRLAGEACISCRWQHVSATLPAPASGRNQSQNGYFKLYTTLVVQDSGMVSCGCRCLLIIYRGTSVLLCGVSLISVVEL